MNPWINHVKQFSEKHNLSYRDALRHPKCKSTYMVAGAKTEISAKFKKPLVLPEKEAQIIRNRSINTLQKKAFLTRNQAINMFNDPGFCEAVKEELGLIHLTPGDHCAYRFDSLSQSQQQHFIDEIIRFKEQQERRGMDSQDERLTEQYMSEFGF